MQVIGLTGFAQAGKSTVAQYLVEQHGFTRLSFAAPLKKMLRTLNPYIVATPIPALNPEPLRVNDLFSTMTENEIKASSAGDEYRRLLQVLGTDCIRAVDENFWVKAAIMQMVGQDGNYVFDDVRFPNEANVIKGYATLGLWYVERPGIHAVNGHASEQHAGKMGEQVWLLNSMGTQELFDQVDYHVTQLALV